MNGRCEDCKTPTPRTRCPACERTHDRQRRPTTAQRGLGAEYQRNRAIVLGRAQGRCYSLGCPTTATTADHIVPRKDGGDSSVANLRASCVKHNSGRR